MTATPVQCRSKAAFDLDGHAEYTFKGMFTLYADVLNILNQGPSFDANAAYGLYGFNPSWQDRQFIGRWFRIGAKVDFGGGHKAPPPPVAARRRRRLRLSRLRLRRRLRLRLSRLRRLRRRLPLRPASAVKDFRFGDTVAGLRKRIGPLRHSERPFSLAAEDRPTTSSCLIGAKRLGCPRCAAFELCPRSCPRPTTGRRYVGAFLT